MWSSHAYLASMQEPGLLRNAVAFYRLMATWLLRLAYPPLAQGQMPFVPLPEPAPAEFRALPVRLLLLHLDSRHYYTSTSFCYTLICLCTLVASLLLTCQAPHSETLLEALTLLLSHLPLSTPSPCRRNGCTSFVSVLILRCNQGLEQRRVQIMSDSKAKTHIAHT